MSRTKPNNNIKNPAVATLEWAASEGHFTAWDSVNKERIVITDSIRLAVLDQLGNISGWVKDLGSCRCNESHNLTAAPIQVFAWKDGKSRLVREGMYREIKDEMKAMGIKYHKIVYCLNLSTINGIPAGEIVKLDLGGAAMSEWIDAGVRDDWSIEMGEPELVEINKMIKYMKPAFIQVDSTEEEDILAEEADKKLQEYFSSRKKEAIAVHESPSERYTDADAPAEEEPDNLPF
jgi:hypothetical protein